MSTESGTQAGPGTMMEWIIDVYQRIRLYIALGQAHDAAEIIEDLLVSSRMETRRAEGRTIFELTLPRFVPEAQTAVASVEVGERKSVRPPSGSAFSLLPAPAWTERLGGAVPQRA